MDQFNRQVDRKNKKLESFYDWLSKQKSPLNRRSARKCSTFKLKEMKDVGITFVELFGNNCSLNECAASHSFDGKKIKIEEAPSLPLPGCDKKHCPCMWLARE